MRVAFLMANEGVEMVEMTRPWEAVRESGGRPQRVAPSPGEVQAFSHLDKAERFPVDWTTSEVDVESFDALVLPGGVANPDQLRMDRPAVALVQAMFAAGKPAAVICHGPWTLVEADVVRGRTLTSWPSLQTDIRNAGGTWVDEEVKVCEQGPNVLVTSRKPDDVPAFCDTLLGVLAAARNRSSVG
ncbi:MAG: type 1 glutamine amidotransferase domain-containing protein [Acidimicrobiales bacterium]